VLGLILLGKNENAEAATYFRAYLALAPTQTMRPQRGSN